MAQGIKTRRDLRPEIKPKHFVFTSRWHKTQPSTMLERLDDSLGKNFVASVGAIAGYSDFDSLPIISDLKQCNLNNGIVTAYEEDPNFTYTPVNGDVMLEIPKFYCKISPEDPSYTDFSISTTPIDSNYIVSPAHMDRGDGQGERNKVYLALFPNTTGNRSIGSGSVLVNTNRTAFRTSIRARGNGYNIWDLPMWWTIRLLYLIEVANWNSQTVIGAGRTFTQATPTFLANGTTTNVAWHSGRSSGTDDQVGVKYHGIENLWGNISQYVDGVNYYNGSIYVAINPSNFGEKTTNGHRLLSYTVPTSGMGDFIQAYGHDAEYPWAMLPININGGSYSTFVPDGYYVQPQVEPYATGWEWLYTGGEVNHGTGAGLFSNIFYGHSQDAYASVGARMMFLPDN